MLTQIVLLLYFISSFRWRNTPRRSRGTKYCNCVTKGSRFLEFPERRASLERLRLWLTRYDAEGHLEVRHGPGRPRATTEAEDASIVARAKETPLTTATSIKHSLELNVSSATVRKRLKEAGLKHHIPAVKEILTETHRRRRVQFARDHLNFDWQNVVFSDEKMFSSEGPVKSFYFVLFIIVNHFQMLIMNWYIFYRLHVIVGERRERGFSLKMSRNDFIAAGNRCPCSDGWREVE